MDLRLYYQKIREVESKIAEEFPIVISRETGDGGREGAETEVPRRLAAKMVVDGMARVASAAEAALYREAQAEAKRIVDQVLAAAKVQLTVLPTAELNKLKAGGRASKD